MGERAVRLEARCHLDRIGVYGVLPVSVQNISVVNYLAGQSGSEASRRWELKQRWGVQRLPDGSSKAGTVRDGRRLRWDDGRVR